METMVLNQTETQTMQTDNDVCVVILQVENKNFNTTTKPYNIKMLGKTMTEWVANSVFDAQIRYATIDIKEDFLPVAKRVCEPSCKHTVVLFSDTPLFERKTYLQIMQYVKAKSPSVLRLTRGYVFETEYLLAAEKLLAPQTQYFEEEDFMVCYDLKQTSIVADVLRGRILNYFNKNGVYVVNPTTVSIDAECQIEPDCVLKTNVQICGKSVLEQGVICNNCKVVDSVVCQNCQIEGAVVEGSFVGKNCKIGVGCIVKNGAKLEDNVVLPPYVVVDGVVVTEQDELQSFVTYKG